MKIKKHLSFTALRRKASEVFGSVQDERQKSKTSISIHDAIEKCRTHLYEWMNDVPLYGGEKSIHVNYLRCTISGKKTKKIRVMIRFYLETAVSPIFSFYLKTLLRL